MKVICTLPNASTLINGVAFKARGEVMVSEDISEEAANAFAEIAGYEILPDTKEADAAAAAAKAAADADADADAKAAKAAAADAAKAATKATTAKK